MYRPDVAQLEELRETVHTSIRQLEDAGKTAALSSSQQKALEKYREQRAELDGQIAEARAFDRAAAERRAETVAEITGGGGRVIRQFGDNATMPANTPADLRAVAGGEITDKATADFRAFIRTGEQRASMSYTDANGGYAVPNPIVASIVDKLKAQDPILSRAKMFPMQGGNKALEIPVVSALGATAWVAETDARPEQNSPTFGQVLLTAYEVYTDWRATQTFIDSVPGIEDWITSEIVGTILAAAGVKFAVGTGNAEIKGLFANTASGYTISLSGVADALANTAFTAAYAALPQAFQPGACWVMKPATLGVVLNYVYPNTQTPLVQYVNGQPTILGKPVLLSDSAPAIGNGAYPVFYGDLSAAYAVGMHQDVNILRDPYSAKPYVSYYCTARIGGVPLNNEAGVLIKSDDA